MTELLGILGFLVSVFITVGGLVFWGTILYLGANEYLKRSLK